MTSRTTRPPRSASKLVFLFPPSLGKPKASARAELLAQNLTFELKTQVEIHVTTDYQELERRALSGEAHLVWAPAGVCGRLEPIAREVYKAVRQGASTYRSALVVRKDERHTLDRLEGLRAAWVDPYSVGGYLLAVDHLRKRGVDADAVFSEQRFHGSHPEALNALTGRSADITAVTAWVEDERSIRDALALHIGPIERKLAILAITDEAPTDAVVLTTMLPKERSDQIADKLFPTGDAMRAPTFLLAAMGAEAFTRTTVAEYRPLVRLLDRLSERRAPTSRR